MTYKILCFFIFGTLLFGGIKRVPSEYSKIQLAINAAVDGDTVLVSPGTYFENINFLGKKITVGSLFLTTSDNQYVSSTIINGSTPSHPDTASCVIFINHEDSLSVLCGFTLTGGKGTRWTDEHGGSDYYEGGGVLTALCSPTIRNNIFLNNEAIRKIGSSASAGGGGIRSGDGAPRIIGNVFIGNKGMYGGAIVLNYCSGALIKNNIIVQNYVYQAVPNTYTFGGGGIWINNSLNNTSNIIANNTIVGNYAYGSGPNGWAGYGGGLYANTARIVVTNNIIWNNTQRLGTQVRTAAGTVVMSYNDCGEALTGTGNISVDPAFSDTSFILSNLSSLIDAGNPDASYNDLPDPLNNQLALYPSKGTLRNDIGAYGGNGAWLVPAVFTPGILFLNQSYDFGTVNLGNYTLALKFYNSSAVNAKIDSVSFKLNLYNELSLEGAIPGEVLPGGKDSISVKWTPAAARTLADTVLIYHDNNTLPLRIPIRGVSQVTGINEEHVNKYSFALGQNYPNPFNPATTIKYSLAEKGKVTLKIYDVSGREMQTLVNTEQDRGEHEVHFSAAGLASGIYFYQLHSGSRTEIKKLIILK